MITDNPKHPGIKRGGPDEVPVPQNEIYLVLSEEERKKGFVRPVRSSYRHVGIKPKYPLRDLTEQEHKDYDQYSYIKFEKYPRDENSAVIGRYWTQKDLDNKGCGSITTMGPALCETYARKPTFYGSTYCCCCQMHRPVEEFVWIEADGNDGAVMGT
jgi:hypothetical protein